MRLLLELLGFRVEVAADGPAGVGKALSWRPQCAVVDIGLPLLDGYGVARQVRAGMGGAVFLIALTGYGTPGARQKAAEAGFDAFMTKPADFGVLAGLLRQPA